MTSKLRDMHWKASASPKIGKGSNDPNTSNLKVMLIICFDIKDVITIERVPQGQTIKLLFTSLENTQKTSKKKAA